MPELDPSKSFGRDGVSVVHESRTFPSRLSEIQRANSFLVACISRAPALPIGEALLFDLRLAVTETFANIVEHSYGSDPDQTIRMTIRLDADRIELGFADVGRRPEARRLRWRNLAEFRERGLGLFLLSKCMDSVTFHFRADGVNRIHLMRALVREGAVGRVGEHLPFHTAVFDAADLRTIYPIGHFSRDRLDPFVVLPPPIARRVLFDLTNLDFLDSYGVDCLAQYARLLWREGFRVTAMEPPAAVAKVIRASGLMDILVPDGWAPRPVELSRASEPALEGSVLPLVRGLTSVIKGVPDGVMASLMSSLVPPRFAAGGIEGEVVLAWGEPSCGLFVRAVARRDAIEERTQGAASGGIIFVGCFSRPGAQAIVAVHQLHAMLGSFPAFARARGERGILAEFLQHVSGLVRDALPPSSEGDAGELRLSAVEFSPRGVRAVTGTGPALVRCELGGGVEPVTLSAVVLGQSENSVFETIDLPLAPGHALRLHVSAGDVGVIADEGVLDAREARA